MRQMGKPIRRQSKRPDPESRPGFQYGGNSHVFRTTAPAAPIGGENADLRLVLDGVKPSKAREG